MLQKPHQIYRVKWYLLLGYKEKSIYSNQLPDFTHNVGIPVNMEPIEKELLDSWLEMIDENEYEVFHETQDRTKSDAWRELEKYHLRYIPFEDDVDEMTETQDIIHEMKEDRPMSPIVLTNALNHISRSKHIFK